MISPRCLTRASSVLIAACLLAAAPLVRGQATLFAVDLSPPWTPGQTYVASVTAADSNRTVLRQGAAILQDQTEKRTVRLDAEGRVIAAFPHGGLRKTSLTIRSLRVSRNGGPESDFLPGGTRVIAEGTGFEEQTFTIDGHPATEEQAAVLKLVISTDDPTHNDQLVFGPKQPVAIGESWQPDVEILKATFGKDLGAVPMVTSAMKLDRVEGAGPARISAVSGTMTFEGFAPPLPPGIKAKSGVFRVKLDSRIPAARSAATYADHLGAEARFVGEAKAPDGTAFTVTVTVETSHAGTLTFP